jgi:hypothetical protein
VQQTVTMPYVLGLTFMLKGRPWDIDELVQRADLDGAYADPPRSTRQILHPEQYWGGRHRRTARAPELADLSSALGPGWTRAITGSIGELGLACMTGTKLNLASMDSYLPQSWTSEVASGSVGDVFHHYVNGNRRATVLVTQWESLRDAQQFATAMRKAGRGVVDMGPTVVVLGGDLGDRLVPVATAALQGRSLWTN